MGSRELIIWIIVTPALALIAEDPCKNLLLLSEIAVSRVTHSTSPNCNIDTCNWEVLYYG